MKILIVDDNVIRAKSIKKFLISEKSIPDDNIKIRYNSSSALSLMRRERFDVLILDVVLPYLDEEASCLNSYKLLENIANNPKFKKPRKIIGITAHISDIGSFKEKFDSYCFSLIEASNDNPAWKGNIMSAINYEIESEISRSIDGEQIICITVHGIRTKGHWQQTLKHLVNSRVGKVQHENFKFGRFDLISFFIPFLRLWVVNRFKRDLENIISNNQSKKIFIFSHSFGTYVAIKAIEKIKNINGIQNIHKIILSGSVLKSNHDLDKVLRKTDAKIINDCGNNDLILSLSEMFIPNTGMAGRTGFHGLNNEIFSNRYFQGGHSHYFEEDSKFMDNYWIPLFADSEHVDIIDNRKENDTFNEIIDFISEIIGKFKEIIYVSLLFYLAYLIFITYFS